MERFSAMLAQIRSTRLAVTRTRSLHVAIYWLHQGRHVWHPEKPHCPLTSLIETLVKDVPHMWGCPASLCQSNGWVFLRSLTRKKTGGYHVCRQISPHSHGCEISTRCTEAARQLLQTAGSSARALLHAASEVPALRLVTAQICLAVCHLAACSDSG